MSAIIDPETARPLMDLDGMEEIMTKQKVELSGKVILVTGSPGFIGANFVMRLLGDMLDGHVISLDNMNDHYDVKLKDYRLSLIENAAKTSCARHTFIRGDLADKALVDEYYSEKRCGRKTEGGSE